MIELKILGETPAKKNANKFNAKTKTMYKDKHYREWHEGAEIQINAQKAVLDVKPIDYAVMIALRFYHGDNVRRDSDNQASSIMDLLQDTNILLDDNWQIVRILNIYNFYEKGNARCEIKIERLEEK